VTKIRPSGAKAIAVGFDKPLATRLSVKPVGRVAALAAEAAARRQRVTRTVMKRPECREEAEEGEEREAAEAPGNIVGSPVSAVNLLHGPGAGSVKPCALENTS
jgi:hypothetical protein